MKDIFGWIGNERRQGPRKAGAFRMWWRQSQETTKTGVGTELSAHGIVFVMPDLVADKELNVIALIRSKNIPMRVTVHRKEPVQYNGATWHRYSCDYTGVAADHWDLIVRYVNDVPETDDRRAAEIQAAAAKPDDAYRMLPMKVQTEIIRILVEKSRLAEPRPGQSPLLKMFYRGEQKRKGEPVHIFSVHSRVQTDDRMAEFDTKFAVMQNGTVSIDGELRR